MRFASAGTDTTESLDFGCRCNVDVDYRRYRLCICFWCNNMDSTGFLTAPLCLFWRWLDDGLNPQPRSEQSSARLAAAFTGDWTMEDRYAASACAKEDYAA
jgi:hypothetical protein